MTLKGYLDSLNDAGRDRIIEAQDWLNANLRILGNDRCLVEIGDDMAGCFDAMVKRPRVTRAYDRACRRFGLARIVVLVKARAAKNHRILLPAAVPQSETAGAV